MDPRLLIMDCDYTNPDDILVDAIIAGVRHIKVQERLLDQGNDLSLAKTLDIGRQYENSQKQLKLIRNSESHESVSRISVSHRKSVRPKVKRSSDPKKEKPSKTNKKCSRCGLDPKSSHTSGKCPAIGSECKYCHKRDHWIAACKNRSKCDMRMIDEESVQNVKNQEVKTRNFFICTVHRSSKVTHVTIGS
jgi:hypothetical protein